VPFVVISFVLEHEKDTKETIPEENASNLSLARDSHQCRELFSASSAEFLCALSGQYIAPTHEVTPKLSRKRKIPPYG
jgi:hypothetical protein